MGNKNVGFCIQKFVEVTPEQLANLAAAMETVPMRTSGYNQGEGAYCKVFAEIKSVAWDRTHETLTVEVVVYDCVKWCRALDTNSPWYIYEKHAPTQRWVVQTIFDALERFLE